MVELLKAGEFEIDGVNITTLVGAIIQKRPKIEVPFKKLDYKSSPYRLNPSSSDPGTYEPTSLKLEIGIMSASEAERYENRELFLSLFSDDIQKFRFYFRDYVYYYASLSAPPEIVGSVNDLVEFYNITLTCLPYKPRVEPELIHLTSGVSKSITFSSKEPSEPLIILNGLTNGSVTLDIGQYMHYTFTNYGNVTGDVIIDCMQGVAYTNTSGYKNRIPFRADNGFPRIEKGTYNVKVTVSSSASSIYFDRNEVTL